MRPAEGQKATTIVEAMEFIRIFIASESSPETDIDQGKDHGFDLYLPWMMEVVINAPEEEGSRSPTELEVLYMEAAWELVLHRKLRPGPKSVSAENTSDAYGKGFSLTIEGNEWLKTGDRGQE